MQKYKQHRLKLSQVAAAAKSGLSERSARRIEISEALPSQRETRAWRTRVDPLTEVWDSEVVPLLESDGALNAVTLLEELQRRYPGDYETTVLRTLQRRVRQWRAVYGPEREVLSPDKRLSSFDFAAVPCVSKAQVMALAQGHEWLQRGANVLLFGPPGVGKSHLIAGLGHALIDAGRRVLFTRCSELVQRLQAARRDLRLAHELAKLDRFDLLVLDDLSYVRRDQAETSVLFELISERYERKSIAITANTPFSQWDQVFVDAAMTVAAVDRLVHHSTILEMNVESYRRRAAHAAKAPARKAKTATTTETTA